MHGPELEGSATANLDTISTKATIDKNSLVSGVEGSIFTFLSGKGFDPTSHYVYFRALPGVTSVTGGNNGYLVHGAGVAAVPESGTYALMAAGLLGVGFPARRCKAWRSSASPRAKGRHPPALSFVLARGALRHPLVRFQSSANRTMSSSPR